MSTFDMLWFRLIPLTVWMAIAAIIVQAIIWIVRPTSSQTHRISWACVLISGLLFARFPINVPDHRLDLIAATQAKAMVDALPIPAPQSRAPMRDPRASVPGPTSAPVSPARENRIRAPQLGVRIESEVSAVPAAALLPRLQSAWRQIALLSWGLVAAGVLGMGALSYIRFARRVRRFEPASGEWAREWHELLHKRRTGRQIPLVVSESWGPALCLLPAGFRVIVPKSLWNTLSATERIAILRHELAHYERNDLLKSLLARLVVALHWFNPAAWWARRQFEAAGEWACDDQAAAQSGSLEFAKTLMQLAGIRFASVPLTDSVGTGPLYTRIRRLLTAAPVVDGRWKRNLVAGISFTVVALALIRVNRVAETTSPIPGPVVAQESARARDPRRPVASPPAVIPITGRANLDQFGDPLPPGVVMRLGTNRFRPPNNGRRIALSPDATTIATCGWNDSGIDFTDRRSGKLIRRIDPPDGKFWRHESIAFSPDGAWLVSAGTSGDGDGATGSHPGIVQAWKTADGKEAWKVDLDAATGKAVVISADGTLIASGDTLGRVIIWDVTSRRRLHTFSVEDATIKQIRRRVESTTPKNKSVKEAAYIEAIAFTRDASFIVAAEDGDATIHVWDVQSEKEITRIPQAHENQIVSLAVTPDGNQIISGGNRVIRRESFGKPYHSLNVRVPEIRVWDLRSGARQREFNFTEPTAGDGRIALSEDGKVLASATEGKILVWDAVAGRVRCEIPATDWYGDLALSTDGKTVAAPIQGSIGISDVATGQSLSTRGLSHEGSISAITESPDCAVIYTASSDGRAIAWNSVFGKSLFEVRHGPRGAIRDLAISNDGRRMATAGLSDYLPSGLLYTVRIWDAHTGAPLRELCDMQYDPRTKVGKRYWNLDRVAFSPDGRLVAVAGTVLSPGDIDVWDIETAKKVAEIRNPPKNQVMALAFSADGKKLWTCELGSLVRLWDISSATLEKQFLGSKIPPKPNVAYGPLDAIFAPDLMRLITSERKSLITWGLATGDAISAIDRVTQDQAQRVTVSRDGRFIAVADANFAARPDKNIIRVFEQRTTNEAFKYLTGNAHPSSLAFSSDGRRLLSGMSDGTALVWDLSPVEAKTTN